MRAPVTFKMPYPDKLETTIDAAAITAVEDVEYQPDRAIVTHSRGIRTLVYGTRSEVMRAVEDALAAARRNER